MDGTSPPGTATFVSARACVSLFFASVRVCDPLCVSKRILCLQPYSVSPINPLCVSKQFSACLSSTGGEKLDALRLTFYTSPVTLGLLAPVSLGMEWDRMIERLGLPAPPGEEDTFVTGSGLMTLVFMGCCNAVVYNWVHNKVIAVTSATTTTVLGNVKVAMLVLFSRVLFGETKDWSWQMLGGGATFAKPYDERCLFARTAREPCFSCSGLSRPPVNRLNDACLKYLNFTLEKMYPQNVPQRRRSKVPQLDATERTIGWSLWEGAMTALGGFALYSFAKLKAMRKAAAMK